MRIEKCCSRVRLPGGERRWRRMARLAKFDGTIKVRDFNKSDRAGGGVDLGTYQRNTVTIRVKHGHGIDARPVHYDPLGTFGHELGHFILERRGRPMESPAVFTNRTAYGQNPVERACDRYSRLLRAKS